VAEAADSTKTSSPAAVAEIDAGVCGHRATIRATKTEGYSVRVTIESDCPHVAKIATEVDEVDALQQIGLRNGLPPALESAYRHCIHAACPVPSGLIKTIEVAAGLALPRDVHMCVGRDEQGRD
jgi:hypothetical protein